MAKNKSIFTSGAKALLPAMKGEATTQAEFKISKADLTGIVSTALSDSIEEELNTRQKELDKLIAKRQMRMSALEQKEYTKAVKMNAFKVPDPENIRLTCSKEKNWMQNRYVEGIEVSVQYVYPAESIQIKNALQPLIRLSYCDRGYLYTLPIPENFIKEDKAIDICKEAIQEIKNRLSKASNSKYITAQLNLGLLSSITNGGDMADKLSDLVENLKTTVFAKKDKRTELSE